MIEPCNHPIWPAGEWCRVQQGGTAEETNSEITLMDTVLINWHPHDRYHGFVLLNK